MKSKYALQHDQHFDYNAHKRDLLGQAPESEREANGSSTSDSLNNEIKQTSPLLNRVGYLAWFYSICNHSSIKVTISTCLPLVPLHGWRHRCPSSFCILL
ncbi:hypothetical protein AVEN_238078-1 [Araneus ventricosus]|uniref:Uncharacterized protein n=1 Tax=Araneus ventricosus TaxID=182803 RepID=A0A4Y2R7Y9_ARAVE|nr:hypothetical protein AVEN_238078-1 [Araneus ventricosus]